MNSRLWLPWVSCLGASLLASFASTGATAGDSMRFESVVKASDRIVVGTVRDAGVGSVRLPGGQDLALGAKDPATGLVFTPYRIRIAECLFDKDDSCTTEDIEVLVPGGTVYETGGGERRLQTWELAGGAGAPLPHAGDDVLLFMVQRNGRYFPINDRGARVPVERSQGQAAVVLHFASPRFLSPEALESVGAQIDVAHPAAAPPVFTESVGIDRLKALIALAR